MIDPETRSDEQAVLEASQAFYAAIQSLDTERMERLWLQDERSRCVHPGWDVLEGWEEIRQSWANIFRNTKRMQVRVSQLSVQVVGDLAWACCVEDITYASEGGFGTALVGATNIFLRLNGRWLMVQHHASQLPSSKDSKFPVQ